MTEKELLIMFSFDQPATKGNKYLPPLLGDSRDRGGGVAGGVFSFRHLVSDFCKRQGGTLIFLPCSVITEIGEVAQPEGF